MMQDLAPEDVPGLLPAASLKPQGQNAIAEHTAAASEPEL
jgi:hypothetical protein